MKHGLMLLTSVFVLTAAFAAAGADFAESFEAETYPLIVPAGCQAERVKEHVSEGEWALKVTFAGNELDTWPGLNVDLSGQPVDARMVLSFDVFNPSNEAVGLSYRIDSADGKNTFGGESLKAEAATKVEIWLSAIASELDVAHITRVFPYIRMPRKDYVLFFDNLKMESVTERFTRTGYIEIAQPLEVTAGADAPHAVVFRRNELGHVFPNSLPWPGEPIERVAVFATRGETEPLALSFRTLSETKRASLMISDLAYVGAAQWEASLTGTAGSAQEGAPLPAAVVEIGCVRYLDKKVTYSSTDYYADMPTYVEEGNAFENLPANVTRTFWLRFRVPADAMPGLYRGAVRFEFDDAVQELPIALTVLPFALPEPAGYFIGEYYRPWGYKTDEEWKVGVAEDLADMRDHGMTSVGACFGFDTERVTVENGQFNLGLDGTTRFEHFLDTYVKLGFSAPVLLLADSGQGAAVKAGEYGTPEHDAAYKAFWTAVQAVCKERGWPELIVQPVDEPSWQGQEERDRNVYLLKLLKEIPGMRTEQDGPADAYFRELAGPFADMWNYNGGIDEFEQVREIRKNHLVAFYNNDVESYRPEVDRYVAGFFTKAADIDGIYNWEYRGGYGSLYDNLDGKTGDWVHHFRASSTSKGGPSIAWEMAREGVDDLRYLVLFDEWLGKARAKEANSAAVKKADTFRAYVFESLQASPRVRSREQWSDTWPREEAEVFAKDLAPDTPKFVGGDLKQPNGWSLQDYQRARWAVALSTVELMAACGESVNAPTAAAPGTASLTIAGATPYPERARAVKEETSAAAALAIPHLSAAPALDGALDDAVWKEALPIERFVSNLGTDVAVQTTAVVGWFGENLYVGVRCDEPHMQNRSMTCLEDGQPCYVDDCVEFFFDPGGSRKEYAQLAFNSRPVQWSQDARGAMWKQRVPVQAGIGENEWRIETAIPLSEAMTTPGGFGFNVCRERRAGGSLELSCWKPTGESFGNPSAFALVRLEGYTGAAGVKPDALGVRLADAFLESNDVLNVETEWSGEPALLKTSTLRFRLMSGATIVGEAALPSPTPARVRACLRVEHATPGDYEVEAAVIGQDGAALAAVKRACRVVPARHP